MGFRTAGTMPKRPFAQMKEKSMKWETQKPNGRRWALLVVLITGLICSRQALGQNDNGAIVGTVTDSSGAVIAGADVKAVQVGTGVTKSLKSDSTGFFTIESLSVGDYTVTVANPGFSTTTVKNIHVEPGQRKQVNVQLTVGNVSSNVVVETNPLAVETQSSDSSATIDSRQIETLLVNGRNFQTLAALAPGVNNTNGNNQYQGGGLTSSTTLSIGGVGIDNVTYQVDGVYNMNTGNYNNLNISPSMDVISEFRLLKANYSARYGSAGSATVLVDTKSGTKTYHGTAWEYLRNDAMDASNYYSSGLKSSLRQDIYGFSLGGPVQIPHLFNTDRSKESYFFASVEWWNKKSGASRTTNVFTQAMDGGDLTGSRGFPTGGLSLTPEGQELLASKGLTNCISSPTTLNPNCLDSNAQAFIKAYYPAPNIDGNGFNYINNLPDQFDQIDHDYRYDQNIGKKNVLTGRIMYEEADSINAASTWGGGNVPSVYTSIYTTGLNATVRLTSTFTPTLVNTASIAETYDKPRLNGSNLTMPSGVTINQYFSKANAGNRIPNISISSYDSIGAGAFPVHASDGEGVIADDLSKVIGRHDLQFGGFWMFGIKNQNTFNYPFANFTFDGVYTGSAAADFLLGLHHGYYQDSEDRNYHIHYRQSEFYGQDDFKVLPRLTINAGMRFFYYSPDWFTGDTLTSTLDYSRFAGGNAPVVQPDGSLLTNADGVPVTSSGSAADLQNGLVFNNQAGVPRGFYDDHTIHLAPRVGFAYALTGDNRTSLRGGYGIGYTRVPFAIINAYGSNPPGISNVSFTSGTFENPAGSGPLTVQAARPQSLFVIPTGSYLKFKPAQVQSFSLSLQREVIPNAIFELAYVGSLGRDLRVNIDNNQPKPVTTPYLSSCLPAGQSASSSYDYDPCINTGLYSEDFFRPYQGYSSLSQYAYAGNTNYNSLQSAFRYRHKNFETTVNYTFSKGLGDGNDKGTGDFRSQSNSTQDSYHISKEYGVSNFDRTHIFNGNVIYNLPFFADSGSLLARQALGGWSFSTIVIAQSGFALTPTLAQPNTGLASRPNQVGAIHISGNRQSHFNADAFAIPAYGFFGNASPGDIRGPKDVAVNSALYKTFKFTERLNFEFRAEAFNLFNHPNFQSVNTGIGINEPNPGLVNSPEDPRILEVAGRIRF